MSTRSSLLHNRLKRVGTLGASALGFLRPKADYSKIESLSDLYTSLGRVRFKEPMGVGGWLSPREQQALYALARWSPGPILEIGPWLGRSTVCLARGVQDSGVEKQ